MTTIQQIRKRTTEILVHHYPNWTHPGVCRCGYQYGTDPGATWAQHASACLFPLDAMPPGADQC